MFFTLLAARRLYDVVNLMDQLLVCFHRGVFDREQYTKCVPRLRIFL